MAAVPPDRIVGIGLVAQFFSLVPVDADAKPTHPLLLWMDGRGAPDALALLGRDVAPTWIEHHGMIPLPSGTDTLSKMLWLGRERPEVLAATAALLEPVDYLAARLTGRFTANPCTAFAYLLADHRDPNRGDWDDELVALAGVDPTRLPEMVETGAAIAPLRPDVATALGLSPSTVVYSGLNDTQAVALGAGTGRDGVGGVNIGTTDR